MTWRRSTTELVVAPFNTGNNLKFIQEFKTFMDSCAAEPDFPWTVASSAFATPGVGDGYVVLKRKNGAPGRVYMQCASDATTSSSGFLGNATGTTSGVSIGYDRTATSDTPLSASQYKSGAPFGGSFGTNWLGASFITQTGSFNFSAGVIFRAYTKTTEDILVLHFIYPNNNNSVYIVGNFIKNQITNQYQLGQVISYLCANFAGSAINSVNIIDDGLLQYRISTHGDLQAGLSNYSRGATWDSVNGFQRLYRTTMVNPAGAFGVAGMNSLFINTDGTRFFMPIHAIGSPAAVAIATQKFFRLGYIGIGENRTRPTSELLDNTLAVRGYYLGYHDTPGSDLHGISILNVDFP